MPRYEYECAKCQIVHELTQKFSDAPMANCPDCQGPVTKLFSQSSFALKGTGWYTTDYKRAGKSTAPSTARSATTATASTPAAATPAPAAAPASTK